MRSSAFFIMHNCLSHIFSFFYFTFFKWYNKPSLTPWSTYFIFIYLLVELDALTPYKVASVGERVEFEVNITKKMESPIKWRHNGAEIASWDNQVKVEIEDVQPGNAGIYECYYEGRRNEGVHALMRLIVRSKLFHS